MWIDDAVCCHFLGQATISLYSQSATQEVCCLLFGHEWPASTQGALCGTPHWPASMDVDGSGLDLPHPVELSQITYILDIYIYTYTYIHIVRFHPCNICNRCKNLSKLVNANRSFGIYPWTVIRFVATVSRFEGVVGTWQVVSFHFFSMSVGPIQSDDHKTAGSFSIFVEQTHPMRRGRMVLLYPSRRSSDHPLWRLKNRPLALPVAPSMYAKFVLVRVAPPSPGAEVTRVSMGVTTIHLTLAGKHGVHSELTPCRPKHRVIA